MEALLGIIAFWTGMNFGALLRAALIGGGVVLVLRLAWRRPSQSPAAVGIGAFFVAFGYQSSQIASGWAYLLSEDRRLAMLVQVLVLGATAALAILVIRLRATPRLASVVGLVSVLGIGSAVPVVQRTVPRAQSARQAASADTPSAPQAYPAVPIWTSESDGFAVQFPTPPRRVTLEAAQGSGYAYQSAFTFADGGAIAGVMIVPIPFTLDSASQRTFLLTSHRSFLQTITASPDRSLLRWTAFGDGRVALEYENRFSLEGVPVVGRGFWLVDGRRTFRVFVAYPLALSAANADVAEHFLRTFLVLSAQSPSINRE